MAETQDPLRCPHCHTLMQTGFLPISQGMHFIRGDGKAASHFAESLPGTHSVMRSNRLLAWRCKACEVVLFKYGRNNAKTLERLLNEDKQITPEPTEEELNAQHEATRLRRD